MDGRRLSKRQAVHSHQEVINNFSPATFPATVNELSHPTNQMNAPINSIDPLFAERVRRSAEKQNFITLIGAKLTRIAPGEVEFTMPFRADLTQQHGFVHAGVITTLADVACGYAAYTLMPAESEVLSVEFKVNLLRPAAGETFIARARVLKPGKTLTVTEANVFTSTANGEKHIATMLATMICR